MCILGKALGNGFPITAVLGKKEIMENGQECFISSTFWTERTGYVAAIKTLEIMEKIKSWEIISKQGIKIKKLLTKLSDVYNLNMIVSGLKSCPSYLINSKDWQLYKTFITQELLKKRILGGNTTYVSTCHEDYILKIYERALDEIFCRLKKAIDEKNITNLLEGPVCHSGFQRLN